MVDGPVVAGIIVGWASNGGVAIVGKCGGIIISGFGVIEWF